MPNGYHLSLRSEDDDYEEEEQRERVKQYRSMLARVADMLDSAGAMLEHANLNYADVCFQQAADIRKLLKKMR